MSQRGIIHHTFKDVYDQIDISFQGGNSIMHLLDLIDVVIKVSGCLEILPHYLEG